ncbi:MAG: hypothetical protein Q9170_007922, partial [Blastenia crenularia]
KWQFCLGFGYHQTAQFVQAHRPVNNSAHGLQMAFYSPQSLKDRCQKLSSDEWLNLCRSIVVQEIRGTLEKETLCAISINATWTFLKAEEAAGRFQQGTSARWLTDLEKELGDKVVTKKIRAAERHKKTLAAAEAVVNKHWGIGLYEIRLNHAYTKTISQKLAQRYAKLAVLMPLDEARRAIEDAIADRQNSTTSSLNHTCNRDIDAILARYPTVKNDLPADCQDSARHRTRSQDTPQPPHRSCQVSTDTMIPSSRQADQIAASSSSPAVNGSGLGSHGLESTFSSHQDNNGLARDSDRSPSVGTAARGRTSRNQRSAEARQSHDVTPEPDGGVEQLASTPSLYQGPVQSNRSDIPQIQSTKSAPSSVAGGYESGAEAEKETTDHEIPGLKLNDDQNIIKRKRKHIIQRDTLFRPPKKRSGSVLPVELPRGSRRSLSALDDLPDTIQEDRSDSRDEAQSWRNELSNGLPSLLGNEVDVLEVESRLEVDSSWLRNDDVEASTILTPSQRKSTTTDLAGALTTLRPRGSLSVTALELVLARIPVDDSTRIFDPKCFSIEEPKANTLRTLNHRIERVLLPLLHESRKHWTLAEFDVPNGIIHHHDSLPSADSHVRDNLTRFTRDVIPSSAAWQFVAVANTQQTDGFSCGVYVLRYIFRSLVVSRQDIEDEDEGMDNIVDSPVDLNNTPVGDSGGKAAVFAVRCATERLDRKASSLRQANIAVSILKKLEVRCHTLVQEATNRLYDANANYDIVLNLLGQCENLTPLLRARVLGKLRPESGTLQSHIERTQRQLEERRGRKAPLGMGCAAAKAFQEARSKAMAQAKAEKEDACRHVELLKEQFTSKMEQAERDEQMARERKEDAHRELTALNGFVGMRRDLEDEGIIRSLLETLPPIRADEIQKVNVKYLCKERK